MGSSLGKHNFQPGSPSDSVGLVEMDLGHQSTEAEETLTSIAINMWLQRLTKLTKKVTRCLLELELKVLCHAQHQESRDITLSGMHATLHTTLLQGVPQSPRAAVTNGGKGADGLLQQKNGQQPDPQAGLL
uniref:Uncharacterized protein n=1 Tax=Eutreptiella gymnastica TaxID=73025 RepID=A0A7S1NTE3_9EUGL|mmetsp:Transcript_78531/g.138760  ORF Transcript_78531/g.138760 Transcript_78531/m.138760 type:complete len:131 (+) Transcript_78531:682-1074(+)